MPCLGLSRTLSFAMRTNYSKTLRQFISARMCRIKSSSLLLSGSVLITGSVYARLHWKSRVLCHAETWTRTVELESNNSDKEHKFPWKELVKLLLPDIWYLLGAILVQFSSIMFCI